MAKLFSLNEYIALNEEQRDTVVTNLATGALIKIHQQKNHKNITYKNTAVQKSWWAYSTGSDDFVGLQYDLIYELKHEGKRNSPDCLLKMVANIKPTIGCLRFPHAFFSTLPEENFDLSKKFANYKNIGFIVQVSSALASKAGVVIPLEIAEWISTLYM